MKAKPLITSYNELLSLPNFVKENTITPENFANVIADYEIREVELNCCLTDQNGRCGQGHFHGYVIEVSNGSLSIMGKDCAERKFGAQGIIFEGISYYKKTREVHEKLGRVSHFVDSMDDYQQRLHELDEDIDFIKIFYNELSLNIGLKNIEILANRYKIQKSIIEIKSFKLDKPNPEDKDSEKLIYVSTHTIGHISSLNLFDGRDLDLYTKKIAKLREALRDAIKTSNQLQEGVKLNPSQLQKRTSIILSQLNDFINFESEIKQAIEDIRKFIKTDPTILCFMTDGAKSSRKLALYAMAFKKVESTSPDVFLRQLEIQYSTKFRCDRVKAADHNNEWFER